MAPGRSVKKVQYVSWKISNQTKFGRSLLILNGFDFKQIDRQSEGSQNLRLGNHTCRWIVTPRYLIHIINTQSLYP